MTFIELFILSCFKHKQPVRHTTLYHFLKGKRTASTLTYGYFYDLLPYFSLYPTFSQKKYEQVIDCLVTKKMIINESNNTVQITELGLLQVGNMPELPNLNNLNYYKTDLLFWERMLFATQVLSEKSFENSHYLPLETNLLKQQQFKKWLYAHNDELSVDFYEEWQLAIKKISKSRQYYLVGQLVGHERIGQTLNQISTEFDHSTEVGFLLFKDSLHYLMREIETNPVSYPLFFELLTMDGYLNQSESIMVTYQLYEQTKSITETADLRQLKESTITDHLIEYFILLPNRNIIQDLSEELMKQLDEYRKRYPRLRNWVYRDCLEDIPTLTFSTFRFYQFYHIEKENDNG